MWGKKKPDASKQSELVPSNLYVNQPPNVPLPPAEEAIKLNKGATRRVGARVDPQTSWVGPGMQVKGEITGNEDLLIDGSVDGLVRIDDRNLTVGTTARVAADIVAGEVVIYGQVEGNVCAAGRIEIKKEGSLIGDLKTPQILIEDGAYFRGGIAIEKSAEGHVDKNAFPPAA